MNCVFAEAIRTSSDLNVMGLDMPNRVAHKHKCDYSCGRGFVSLKRLRDHLRDCHNEDLPKKGTLPSDEWFEARNVHPEWWRCFRCLTPVRISDKTCPKCDKACEPDRMRIRLAKNASMLDTLTVSDVTFDSTLPPQLVTNRFVVGHPTS